MHKAASICNLIISLPIIAFCLIALVSTLKWSNENFCFHARKQNKVSSSHQASEKFENVISKVLKISIKKKKSRNSCVQITCVFKRASKATNGLLLLNGNENIKLEGAFTSPENPNLQSCRHFSICISISAQCLLGKGEEISVPFPGIWWASYLKELSQHSKKPCPNFSGAGDASTDLPASQEVLDFSVVKLYL